MLLIVKNARGEVFKELVLLLERDRKIAVLTSMFCSTVFWNICLLLIALIASLYGGISIIRFRNEENWGFEDAGEKVKIIEKITDSGINFLMTFILPLIVDRVDSINNFILCVGLVVLVIILISKTNLYYQNPILILLGYKLYRVEFINAIHEECKEKEFIVICHAELDENKIVKWKYIADDICLMYNKN